MIQSYRQNDRKIKRQKIERQAARDTETKARDKEIHSKRQRHEA
jgi:hypothetical protein